MSFISINSFHNTRNDKFLSIFLFIETVASFLLMNTTDKGSQRDTLGQGSHKKERKNPRGDSCILNLWRWFRDMWINAIKGNNALKKEEENERKKVRSSIYVKKYWWSRAQRSLKCFTFNQKKTLFIYSAAMTLLFAVRRFPVAFFLLLEAWNQHTGMKILIYFSCFARFPIDGHPIIHVI